MQQAPQDPGITVRGRVIDATTGEPFVKVQVTRLRDARTALDFVSDFDQRHTVSGYGAYRMAETLDFSAFYRYGSGLMVGFYQEEQSPVSSRRRAQSGAAPDLQPAGSAHRKAFHFHRSKLTLPGEVLNALGRENFRQDGTSREKLIPSGPFHRNIHRFLSPW
jgi:hypothetical protein